MGHGRLLSGVEKGFGVTLRLLEKEDIEKMQFFSSSFSRTLASYLRARWARREVFAVEIVVPRMVFGSSARGYGGLCPHPAGRCPAPARAACPGLRKGDDPP